MGKSVDLRMTNDDLRFKQAVRCSFGSQLLLNKSVIFFFLLLLGAGTYASAQGRYDLDVDKKTYDLFLTKDWKGLKQAAEAALERGVDFYYLRLRLGIAEDNLEKFNRAATQYKKAQEFVPGDTLANWYRYATLIKGGRETEARVLADKLTPWQKKYSFYKPFRLQSISLDGGALVAGKSEIIKINEDKRISPVQNRTEQERYRNIYYTNLLATLFAGKHLGISLGYGFMNTSRESNIGYRQPPLDSVVNAKINSAQFASKPYTTTQNNFYVGLGYQFNHGWSVAAAGNFLAYSGKTQEWTSSRNTANTGNIVSITETAFKGLDYSLSFALRKRLSWLGLEGVFAYNHLSWNYNSKSSLSKTGVAATSNYLQSGLNLSFYPIGNNRLYLTSGLTYTKSDSAAFIFSQKIGGQVAKWLWAEGYISLGYMQGSMEGNSWIVYNNPDQVSWKTGLNLTISISKRVEIPLRIGMMRRQGQGIRFVGDQKGTNLATDYYKYNHFTADPYNYNHFTINTGIKIYF